MNILSPSILAADFWKLGEQVKEIERAGVTYLHIDVMDGNFVPSISFGVPVLQSIRKQTDLFLDVHLMIENPEQYVDEFADNGADMINFHLEAAKDVKSLIKQIRRLDKKVGITIKPATSVLAVEPYLELIDMVLVMTVEPGFGGQKLLPRCLDKVRYLRQVIDERGFRCDVEVDGGVKLDNIASVLEAGANVVVAGSAVFKNDIQETAKEFLSAINL